MPSCSPHWTTLANGPQCHAYEEEEEEEEEYETECNHLSALRHSITEIVICQFFDVNLRAAEHSQLYMLRHSVSEVAP